MITGVIALSVIENRPDQGQCNVTSAILAGLLAVCAQRFRNADFATEISA